MIFIFVLFFYFLVHKCCDAAKVHSVRHTHIRFVSEVKRIKYRSGTASGFCSENT